MPLLLLKLLGFANTLRALAADLFRWAIRNPAWALCAVLGVALFLSAHQVEHWKAKDAKDRAVIVQMNAASEAKDAMNRATIAQMNAASEANHKAQLTAKAEAEQRYKDKADEADRNYHALDSDYRTRLAAYLGTHRMQSGTPDQRPASGSAEGNSTQGSNGPGAASVMVAVSQSDLEICTTNTQRLKVVHDWAVSLAEPPTATAHP